MILEDKEFYEKMKELGNLIKEGYKPYCRGAMVAGLIPIKQIGEGRIICREKTYYYGEDCYDDEEEREYKAFAVDLGTTGIAGQGYDGEEHWYLTYDYQVDRENKRIIFEVPVVAEGSREDRNYYTDGYTIRETEGLVLAKTIDLSKEWKPRTNCGCI